MSTIDPITAATETLQAVSAAAGTAAPILALSNPQAAAVAAALQIGTTQLNALLASLQSGSISATDATTTAVNIANALKATHDAWAALAPQHTA